MKRTIILIFLMPLLTLGACRRRDDNGNPLPPSSGGAVPGMCAFVAATHSGNITPGLTVTLAANQSTNPKDIIGAYICKNAVCASNLPSTNCDFAAPGVPCANAAPHTNVIVTGNQVTFPNAITEGYSTYLVNEWHCE